MKRTVWMVLAMVGMLLTSCQASAQVNNKRIRASKHNVTKNINVGSFDKIAVNGNGTIVFTQTSGRQSLQLSVPDNLQDIVEVYVKNRTLVLTRKQGYSITYNDGAKTVLNVSAPMVKEANINGSADILFKGKVNTNGDLSWNINGSGDIEAANVECRTLNLNVNGSGDIEVGRVAATQVNTSVNGSGDIEVGKATATQVSTNVNGSGNIDVKGISSDKTHASINGSGDIKLSGKTTSATLSLQGSGDISASSLQAKVVEASIARGSSGNISCYAADKVITDNQSRRGGDILIGGNPLKVEK